jgi:Mce-associated membrane protein
VEGLVVERLGPGSAPLTEPTVPESAAPPPTRRRPVVPVLLVLLLCALLVGIVLTVLDRRDEDRREKDRQAALQAARQQAVNMTTISYETADRDLGRIIAAATGTLKTQFEAQQKTFPDVLRKQKSISVGTVLASGVASEAGNKVEALVAVDAAVRNATSGSSPVVKHYRMDMTLVRNGKQWLVSEVAFAGLPQ